MLTISFVTTFRSVATKLLLGVSLPFLMSGCAMMTAAGPSSRAVNNAKKNAVLNADIKIVDVNDVIARRLANRDHSALFSETLGDGRAGAIVIGRGDIVDISIWEAPPAALFGSAAGDSRMSVSATSMARGTSFPEQMVDANGQIFVPFAGSVAAAGKTPQEIERDIAARLAGKAHQPQVIVRLVNNATANVTVVGDVANSSRVPLTVKGERLLDAIASAGGVKQPVGKTLIQITRGQKVQSLPLEAVIRDPRQNIRLQPDDVITLLFQSYSFTSLGATGASAEVPFEGTGISLAQALGRVGGIQDARADAKGVFIFRFEDPAVLGPSYQRVPAYTPDGKIPVIYRINLKDPATFFVVQSFPIQNRDVLYVSNAPLADVQKFVNVMASMAYPIIAINNAIDSNN